ncbi:MAG TPA: prepilin-type N-terminal cleavage/methylation domain-containing protein [Gemmatales bacterium]|nr:prepilin-type N-terminal cleavage/methylation domain-containing protein [Gemmatales bacterium]
MWYRRTSRSGLTLVELLVVITILILLLAMLLPAVMRLRAFSDQQEDREQLRVMGHAWLAYAQAHGGHPITVKASDPFDRWLIKLSPYGDITNYLVSPGDPLKKDRLAYMDANPSRLCSSFVLNPYFSTRILDPYNPSKQLSCDRISDCTSLSRAVAILPVSPRSGVPGYQYILPQTWFAATPALTWARATGNFGIQPDRFSGYANDTMPGFANYFFADGHVETITADQISQWLQSGKNFLIPAQ